MDLKSRIKNPWFWAGLCGAILTAMGVNPEMFTSWSIVWESIVELVLNPYLLVSTTLAVVGILVNPTTKGITDDFLERNKKKGGNQ